MYKILGMIDIKRLAQILPSRTECIACIKGIDFHAKEGEMVAIMGSSGSGNQRS